MSTPHAALQMANNLEGGGRTPLLPPEELEQLGFKLVAYPLSLLGVSMRAMQSALQLLKARALHPAGPATSLAPATRLHCCSPSAAEATLTALCVQAFSC